MARKLNYSEKQLFEEIIREAEPASIEINADAYLQRLKEQQETPFPLNQLALWFTKDPLPQR